jgi:hypothetical protein
MGTVLAYAMPRMRLILPGSTKLRVLTCFTMGQRNRTSPPPSGGEPRFLIFGGVSIRAGREGYVTYFEFQPI